MVTIAFPGLGIEPFSFNKVAFTIPILGGIEVRWYGIVITLGIVLAFFYAWYRAKQEGIILDDLLDIAIYAVITAMIGARLYYVLFDIIGNGNGDNYRLYCDMERRHRHLRRYNRRRACGACRKQGQKAQMAEML